MPARAVVQGNDRRKHWYDSRILVGGRLVAPLSEAYHGKASTYDYYGCRCDLCSIAARQRPRRKPGPRQRCTTVETAEPEPVNPAEPVATMPTFLEPVPPQRQPGAVVEDEPEALADAEPRPPDRQLAAVPDLDAQVPVITRGARAEIVSVDHLRAVVEAYHHPQWTAEVPNDSTLEKRSASGHLVKVNKYTGVVVFVGTSEQSRAAPESLRERAVTKSTKRGGCGSGMPTSYTEIIERLVELGCAVDRSGGRHVTVTLPNGERRSLPRHSGDWRGVRNAVGQFKADGLDLRRGQA